MQDLQIEFQNQRELLGECVEELKRAGKEKAQTEFGYRVALAKEMLILRSQGMPVTIINDLCRGNEEIAKLKMERDIKESNWEVCLQKIYMIKTEIKILAKEIYGELQV